VGDGEQRIGGVLKVVTKINGRLNGACESCRTSRDKRLTAVATEDNRERVQRHDPDPDNTRIPGFNERRHGFRPWRRRRFLK
jgi:hypothetical protein